MADGDEWPGYSDYEEPLEEISEALFRESGEVFLKFLETVELITKVAQAIPDKVIVLDFSNSEGPQEFYEMMTALQTTISHVRDAFVSYCSGMNINLATDKTSGGEV